MQVQIYSPSKLYNEFFANIFAELEILGKYNPLFFERCICSTNKLEACDIVIGHPEGDQESSCWQKVRYLTKKSPEIFFYLFVGGNPLKERYFTGLRNVRVIGMRDQKKFVENPTEFLKSHKNL